MAKMAIEPYATNMGKQGIPEKNSKNVAQLFRWLQHVPTRFDCQKTIFSHFPIEFPIEFLIEVQKLVWTKSVWAGIGAWTNIAISARPKWKLLFLGPPIKNFCF